MNFSLTNCKFLGKNNQQFSEIEVNNGRFLDGKVVRQNITVDCAHGDDAETEANRARTPGDAIDRDMNYDDTMFLKCSRPPL